MRAYSMDLRERILRDSDAGMMANAVAEKYHVSGSWVRVLKQRRRQTGEIRPRPQRYGPRSKLEPHVHTLTALIAEQPDRTLAELQQALGIPVSLPTICRAVKQLGLPIRKRPAQRARPADVATARTTWRQRAPAWDPRAPRVPRSNKCHDELAAPLRTRLRRRPVPISVAKC